MIMLPKTDEDGQSYPIRLHFDLCNTIRQLTIFSYNLFDNQEIELVSKQLSNTDLRFLRQNRTFEYNVKDLNSRMVKVDRPLFDQASFIVKDLCDNNIIFDSAKLVCFSSNRH